MVNIQTAFDQRIWIAQSAALIKTILIGHGMVSLGGGLNTLIFIVFVAPLPPIDTI